MKSTSSQPLRGLSRSDCNSTIIYFYHAARTKSNSIRQSLDHQTFWHASFVKFRQTYPPSKFYAIQYGFVWIIFLNVSLLYTIFYVKQTAHVNASNLLCFKLKYSYSNILVPTCKFVSFLWGNIFEFDSCVPSNNR